MGIFQRVCGQQAAIDECASAQQVIEEGRETASINAARHCRQDGVEGARAVAKIQRRAQKSVRGADRQFAVGVTNVELAVSKNCRPGECRALERLWTWLGKCRRGRRDGDVANHG